MTASLPTLPNRFDQDVADMQLTGEQVGRWSEDGWEAKRAGRLLNRPDTSGTVRCPGQGR